MRRSMENDQTPYTPAIPQLYALQESLALIRTEGLEASARRHHRLARATRAGARALRLEPLAADSCASNALTAIRVPAGVDGKALRQALRERHGLTVAGGQGPLTDAIFRIGHLGWVGEGDILRALAALEMALPGLGWPVPPGAGVAAAQQALADGAGD
jgi:aspartate aminotransferase-like enzyme